MIDIKIYKGIFRLSETFELPCYVVDCGEKVERVLSLKEIVGLISGGRDSGNINRCLSAKNIKNFLPSHLRYGIIGFKERCDNEVVNKVLPSSDTKSPVLVLRVNGNVVYGVRASDVVDICNAYLQCRQANALLPEQAGIAENAEVFLSAVAKTGIDSVIDTVTGYKYFRKAGELQAKLGYYLNDEYKEWAKTFPKEFFMHMYRLEGASLPIDSNQPYPIRFGKYVMHYVYDTLDPEIADYLRRNNPNPQGLRHHHQLLTDVAYKKLSDHILLVMGIIKASPNMERLRENLAYAFANKRTLDRVKRLRHNHRSGSAGVQHLEMNNDVVVQLSLFDNEPLKFVETMCDGNHSVGV